MNVLVLLAAAVPIAGSVVAIWYSGRRIALLCSGISFGLLILLIPEIDAPLEFTVTLWMNPMQIHLFIDGFSLIFALLTSFLFFVAIIYSSHIKGRTYYPLLLLELGLLLFIVFAKELLMLYVFLELSTIVTYFLIVHKRTAESLRAGFKYIIMNVGGALLILLAILLNEPSPVTVFLFVTGCLVKAGSFPVHVWLTDAHPVAPSPVSALLSGAIVKVGAYTLFRFTPHFGADFSFLVPVILASMVVGAFLALVQTDVKRILAYHTVSQIGFVLLGMVLQSEVSISGGMLHLVNHGLFKALLFLCMGCVIHATKERNLHQLGGLYSKMPVTAAACLIGCFSIAGVPPFNGAVSKSILFHALESDTMKIAFILASAGTVASFTKLFRHTFLGEPKTAAKYVPLFMKVPLILLSAACIFLGVFPGAVLFFTGYGIEFDVWNISLVSEFLLSTGLGIIFYVAAVKTEVIFKTPQFRITIDRFFCISGKAVEYFSELLKKWLIQDMSYYAAYMILFLVLFFFFCSM